MPQKSTSSDSRGQRCDGEGSIPEDVGLGNDVEFFFGHVSCSHLVAQTRKLCFHHLLRCHQTASRAQAVLVDCRGYTTQLHDAIVKECDYKSPSNKCEGLIGQMHNDLGHINVYDIYTPCIMDMEKDQKQNKLPSDHRAPFSAERAQRFGTSGPDGCIDAGAAKKYLDVPAVRLAQAMRRVLAAA